MRLVHDSSFGILFALNYKRERGMKAKLARVKAFIRRQTGEPNMWREDRATPNAKLTLSLVAATFVAITMFAVAATAQSTQESQPELTAPLEPLRPDVAEDHRTTASGSLHRRPGEPFPVRREYEDVQRRVDGRHVRTLRDEAHAR